MGEGSALKATRARTYRLKHVSRRPVPTKEAYKAFLLGHVQCHLAGIEDQIYPDLQLERLGLFIRRIQDVRHPRSDAGCLKGNERDVNAAWPTLTSVF